MKKIDFYIKQNQIMRDRTVISLSGKFMNKAKNTLATISILSDIDTNKKAQNLLKIPSGYDSNEWIVIMSYYAMYSSALALIAKMGYKSKNHDATITLLEEFYIKNKLLIPDDLRNLNGALLQKEEIEKLSEAKRVRQIAQYSVTKLTTQDIAQRLKKDSFEFVNKVETIIG